MKTKSKEQIKRLADELHWERKKGKLFQRGHLKHIDFHYVP